MKKLILAILLLNISIFAQTSGANAEAEARRRAYEEEQVRRADRIRKEQEFNRMKAVGELGSVSNSSQTNLAVPVKLSKEQKKRRRPDSEDSTKFAAFLKLPQTGLFKLFPNMDCSSTNTVRVSEECKDAMPLSSYYSFQKRDYTGQIAEIGLKDNNFYSRGLLVNALLVTLGDVPLETVSINSDGVKFLADFQPAREDKEISAKMTELAEGIKNGNYQYAASVPALENTTFAVRVIAYRGKLLFPLGDGRFYNLLEKDKRTDIIVVFRTVRKSADGSWTILWKQLQQKDSPIIELTKEEQQKYLLGISWN